MQNNKLHRYLTEHQAEIAVITSLGMVFGFLCARAILSVSMFLFCLNVLWTVAPKEWVRQKWWLTGMIWVGLYAVSYFWSDDIPYWNERIQVKFPFIILPLAFAFLKPLPEKQLRWFSSALVLLMAAGCIYSLSFYFADPQKILSGYFYSQVFPTPAYKDHIRYSIFVAWTIIWCCYSFRGAKTLSGKVFLSAALLFFCIYLHILAVRSGLLVLYSFAGVYIFYLFLRKNRLQAGVILCTAGLLACSAYYTVPSFRTKIHYGLYSLNEYKKGNHSADFSDIGRLISYDLAAKIISEHPVLGVGAGDIREEMKAKYEIYSPQTKPEQRIVPHNQILEVTLAGGLVTLVAFLLWLLYPLRGLKRNRQGFFLFATWFALFVSMLVEPMLEVQFGVFVYLFCLLWMHKATQQELPSPVAGS